MKRILFLTQGSDLAASSRHRVYQYSLPALEKAGMEAVVHPAVQEEEFHEAFIARSGWGNAQRAFRTFTRRVRDLHQLGDFDFVFVQKAILPAPLFNMELRITRESRMIFDFDDAIHLKRTGGSFLSNLWPQANRVASICRRAHKVVVGNGYLADFALKARGNPIILPTVVDTEAFAARSRVTKHVHKIPVIGWVGSPTTQPDIDLAIPSLIDLHSKTPFSLRIIGGSQVAVPVRFPIEWKKWNLPSEIEDIAHLDCGLAPLADNDWNRGKCGLKVLQYWAAGVPVVASPVGVYRDMIRDGENGFLASNRVEWTEKILALIKDPALRARLVAGGKKTVEERFSLRSTIPRFLRIFEAGEIVKPAHEPTTPSEMSPKNDPS